MLETLRSVFLGLLVIGLLNGCASIVSKTDYPVTFNTTPENATIKITNHYGVVIYEGLTPATIPLSASAGFFQKARYLVSISQFGYSSQTFPLDATIDGWYFGNLLFGGLIGMLIVDPATGAMWKLPSQHYQFTLAIADEASIKSLRIMSLNDISEHLRDKMVPLENGSSN